MKTFTIGTNDANQRFDKYLKKLLPNASVSFLYKMLRKKNITLDGKKATGKETLQKGAQVAVFFSDETLHKFMQDTKKLQEEFHMLQRLPMKGLSIIYEDTDILIADKPYNMLSQKAKEQDLSARLSDPERGTFSGDIRHVSSVSVQPTGPQYDRTSSDGQNACRRTDAFRGAAGTYHS